MTPLAISPTAYPHAGTRENLIYYFQRIKSSFDTQKLKVVAAAVCFVLVVTLLSSEAEKLAGDGETVEAREMASSSDSLRRGKVVPDVIDPFTPSAHLKVKYGKNKVKNGEEFTPLETKSSPVVEISPKSAMSKGPYILVQSLPPALECDIEKQTLSSHCF